ncbi:MAG: sulfatase-like hydrolase/transferase, partial [Planctomycetota bacterium]
MDAFRRILPTAAAAVAVLSGCHNDDSTAAPRNLLLITVDTLRADHLGLYGHAGPISPRIDTWGSSALVFEEAHAPSSWTLASLASLMTSGPSSRHGCW